jgi:branched-chain amino acid transport system substrate-binding protein
MNYKGALVVGAILALLLVAGCAAPEEAKKEKEPIIIGMPLPTAYVYGYGPEHAAKLAVEEINAKGGVKVGDEYRPLKLEIIDTRDLEPGVPVTDALAAIEKLILEKKVNVLVGGPARSEAALAAMDISAKYKVPTIISTGVLTPAYHKRIEENYEKYKYCFRLNSFAVPLAVENVEILEDLKSNYGYDKVYVMVQDVEHARKFGEVIAGLLEKKGWKIVGFDKFPTGTTDFSASLLKAKTEGAQILLIQMDMPESTILLKQWTDMKMPAIPIGFIAAAQEQKAWEATGGKINYLIVSSGAFIGNAEVNYEPAMKFYKDYEKRWGFPPEAHGTSSTYAAIYAVAAAIEKAGTLDSDAVVKALEEIDLKGTPVGRIKFDPKSHQVVVAKNPEEGVVDCWFQWQDGVRATIYPQSVAIAEVKLPPWMK